MPISVRRQVRIVRGAGGGVSLLKVGTKIGIVKSRALCIHPRLYRRSLLHIDFGAADRVPYRFRALGNILSYPNFFHHPGLLGDNWLFGELLNFDHLFLAGGEIRFRRWTIDRAPFYSRAFFA